ncbi:MAG: peptidoglycan-binding domain-containing protein [Xanthobacteraceae bacterium]
MKQLVLALLASTALAAVPAFAAPNSSPSQQSQQQSQMQKPQQNAQNQAGANQQQASNQRIQPSQLSRKDVREIQTALNKKGFETGHVDGIWGQRTRQAVQDFQKTKNIQANGHLNNKTLSDLGVQVAANENNGNSGQNNANQNMNSGQSSNMNSSSNMSGSQTPNGHQMGNMNKGK